MLLFGKSIEVVDEKDILRLISSNILESRVLEYKQSINIDKPEEKKEFLADISAMANTDGGVIIFGIKEIKSEAKIEIVGLTEGNSDLLKQKIEDIVRNGIEPKINLRTEVVTVETKKVLLLGIGKNWAIPSMVTYNHTNKFYKRRDTGKFLMDVYELNNAFMAANDITKEADNFRNYRIAEQESINQSSAQNNPAFYLHILPLNKHQDLIDLTDESNTKNIKNIVNLPYSRRCADRLNIEGILIYNEGSIINTYIQLFRNGAIEFYTYNLFEKVERFIPIQHLIKGNELEQITVQVLTSGFKLLSHLGTTPPYAVFITLLNLEKTKITSHMYLSEVIGRKQIYFPPVVFYDYSEKVSMKMKPIFDMVWQSGSFNKSPNYNSGDWAYETQIGNF
jgi:hypothetical protein